MPCDPTPLLDLVDGRLCVHHWPTTVRQPFGMAARGAVLTGPARCRHGVRQTLQAAGRPFTDQLALAPLDTTDLPAPPAPPPPMLPAWCANDARGITCGLAEATRLDLVLGALHTTRRPTLLVVRDSGAEAMWCRALTGHGLLPRGSPHGPIALAVTTVAEAARTMHWRARRHDLLVVDRPEQMPHTTLAAVLDGSPALARLGFVDRPHGHELLRLAAGLGPVLAVVHPQPARPCLELRLPLPPAERLAYEAAWHTFLGAYDCFAALRPQAGFGTFVQQARRDPRQRPALLAWHQALRIASWNTPKAAAIAELLARHRGQRVLVFTPDRQSAYELARAHLIAPVTADLPRAERHALLAAFAAGSLRVLAGPRLLDLGVPEGSADVGLLVGGGYGRAQHDARCHRVVKAGLVYRLVTLDTLEVGRAHRFDRPSAAAPAVADPQ